MRPSAVERARDEVAQHLLGDGEVGDHAVAQRARRRDRCGRTSDHPLGLDTDRLNVAAQRINRDYGRLGRHDAPATDVDHRVRRAEIDCDVMHAQTRRDMTPRRIPA